MRGNILSHTGLRKVNHWATHLMMWCLCMATSAVISSCSEMTSSGGLNAASISDTVANGRMVILSPAVEAGWVGWCVSITGVEMSGSCPDARSRGAILAERWGRGRGGRTFVVAVTASNVTAVSLGNGPMIPTRVALGFPGLRVAVADITNDDASTQASLITHGFTAARSYKNQVAEGRGGLAHSLGYEVRGVGWQAPNDAPGGVCAISISGSSNIRGIRGGVASESSAYAGLVDNAFLTCAGTEYSLAGGRNTLLAGLLTNAARPGAMPGPLPQMRRVIGYPGVYEAPVEGGEMLARHIEGAWLFVTNGPFTKAGITLNQRVALLRDLRGNIEI